MTDPTASAESLMVARSPTWAKHAILAGYRGSHAHGTYLSPAEDAGTDDTDLFGVAVRDRHYYLGLEGYHAPERGTWTSAGEPLDIETHEVRKFCWLLRKGNPNVHQHLWLRADDYVRVRPAGQLLLDHRTRFLSERVYKAYAKYAEQQLDRMERLHKEGYMGAKRERLMREYGYDIKNAAHCIRLLYCGIHLARTGTILVHLEGDAAHHVMAIKRGHWSLDSVKRHARRLIGTFEATVPRFTLPHEVERADVSDLVADVITQEWKDRA